MKIQSINIHNFKGIKSFKGEVGGKHVYLIGGNGTGKTSFIDAVWCGLTGKNLPPEPTHNGAKKGLIELDLGDFIARTKLTKGKPMRFELENKNATDEANKFMKSPRSYLESRIGVINFDVNEFFNKSDAEQVKYFAKMMNVDFSDIDAEIEELMESRKFDKKTLADIRKNQNFYNEEDAAKDYVSVVELSKKIDEETEKSNTYENVKNGVSLREEQIQNKLDTIKDLEAEIAALRSEAKDGYAWLEVEENKPMTDEDILELKQTRDKSEAINERIREAKEAKQADEQADKYEAMIEEATTEIQNYKDQKAQRISEHINIEGLVYDVNEERFLYNGLPFDRKQQNTASQLIAGMKIASMTLKDLKILKIDASLIDKIEFDKVLEWAEQHEIELFVELVDREAGQLEIIVHDE